MCLTIFKKKYFEGFQVVVPQIYWLGGHHFQEGWLAITLLCVTLAQGIISIIERWDKMLKCFNKYY